MSSKLKDVLADSVAEGVIFLNHAFGDNRMVCLVDGELRLFPHWENDEQGSNYHVIDENDPILESEGWF